MFHRQGANPVAYEVNRFHFITSIIVGGNNPHPLNA
jgi:hypothetical protein